MTSNASLPTAMVALAIAVSASGAAFAERRFAVVVGANRGADAEVALKFAELDAQKIADTLVQVGGFSRDDVVVIRGAAPATVRRALIDENDRVRQSQPGEPTLLFVYYSGHADADALHLGNERLDVAELEGLVRGSAASFRVLVVDACRSGAMTNVKGARATDAFALPSGAAVGAAAAITEGYVVLTAATAGEDAQESEALRGSFFTHHLVSGLLGAADRDGDREVTLAEAYRHAFTQTVRSSSATLAGTQHPTFRYDLRGRGDVVLASLARTAAITLGTVALPDSLDFLVFNAADGNVAAEISASAPARLIALPAGKYVVRGRGRDVLYEGEVVLAAGARSDVQLASLTRLEYSRLVRKGEGDRALLLAPRVGVVSHTAWFEDGGACNGGAVAALVATRYLSIGPRVSLCLAGWQNEVVRSSETELSVDVVAAHVFDLPFVTFELGAFGGLVHSAQVFTTQGTAPPLTALSPSFGVAGDVFLDLPYGTFAGVGVEARALAVRVHPSLAWDTPLSLGFRGSLGWQI